METQHAITTLKEVLKDSSSTPSDIDKAIAAIEHANEKDENEIITIRTIARRVNGIFRILADHNTQCVEERDELQERVSNLLNTVDYLTEALGQEGDFKG